MTKEEQLKLGQLISKAWKEGLWHSESSFSQDIKDFVDELEKARRKDLLRKIEGMKKHREECIKTATEARIVEHHRTYNLALQDIKKLIK